MATPLSLSPLALELRPMEMLLLMLPEAFALAPSAMFQLPVVGPLELFDAFARKPMAMFEVPTMPGPLFGPLPLAFARFPAAILTLLAPLAFASELSALLAELSPLPLAFTPTAWFSEPTPLPFATDPQAKLAELAPAALAPCPVPNSKSRQVNCACAGIWDASSAISAAAKQPDPSAPCAPHRLRERNA